MGNGEIINELRKLVADRDWSQFHTPENLAKSISIEAAELLECYQWGEGNEAEIRAELADVITYCYLLADKLNLDVDQIVLDKLEQTKEKYPIDKSFGKSTKHDRL